MHHIWSSAVFADCCLHNFTRCGFHIPDYYGKVPHDPRTFLTYKNKKTKTSLIICGLIGDNPGKHDALCRFLRLLARISDIKHVHKYIKREFPMFRDIKDTRISLGLS